MKNNIKVDIKSKSSFNTKFNTSSTIDTLTNTATTEIPVNIKTKDVIDSKYGNNNKINILKYQLDNETGNYLQLEQVDTTFYISLMSKTGKELSKINFTIATTPGQSSILYNVVLDYENKRILFFTSNGIVQCDISQLINRLETAYYLADLSDRTYVGPDAPDKYIYNIWLDNEENNNIILSNLTNDTTITTPIQILVSGATNKFAISNTSTIQHNVEENNNIIITGEVNTFALTSTETSNEQQSVIVTGAVNTFALNN